ncbi:MAG: mevalonate kinase [Anaerolineae bacterium]|nr:mevalonate kinase [Anaerolineae bacterium]
MTTAVAAEYSAPAKIILFGEHAVVHGQPAIAAPVSSLRAFASVTPASAGSGLAIDVADLDTRLTISSGGAVPDHPLARAACLLLDTICRPPPDLRVTLRSQIPIASGLGSGAALTTALMRALVGAGGMSIPDAVLNELVYEVEREFHGTPSGIDNTVVVYERTIWFVRGEPPALLTVGKPFDLVVADTGVHASTKDAVAGVHALLAADPAGTRPVIEAIGALAHRARSTIARGDIRSLGPLMNENHRLLQRLTASSDELDRLAAAALSAGAWGAKLSGGGRGGNMIALCPPGAEAELAAALLAAGARRTIMTKVEAHE